jgi:hypothetical protein
VICNPIGHHWKRVEHYPAECTRCKVLLQHQYRALVRSTSQSWPKGKMVRHG